MGELPILDFGFWILDFGLKTRMNLESHRRFDSIQNPKSKMEPPSQRVGFLPYAIISQSYRSRCLQSKIQNPKSKMEPPSQRVGFLP
ncbi:MAG: hypothetical protein DMF63_12550 [Acidobacteria bacterium]|nr:MAG: hypothetical protein DMF63_12550 [Acidobacteriota bacterium]